MKRTKHTNSNSQLRAMASLAVTRANLATSLGMSHNGDRDLYVALGYPTSVQYADYFARYKRQDIAKAVIDKPVNKTWEGEVELEQSTDADETKLEKAWDELYKAFKLKQVFVQTDILTSIGRYGIMLLGLDDTATVDDFAKPVTVGTRKLMYLQAFGEGAAEISTYEENTGNKRYGMPVLYTLKVGTPGEGNSKEIKVHYTRVIHVVQEALENNIFGTPQMQAVLNRLCDLEKVVGGDAEMYWRGARPGYQGKVDSDFSMTPETKEDLKDQIDEYEHNLRRILVNEGVSFTEMTQVISDPQPHVDIQIQMISTETTIPKRLLTGSERGELSSAQDSAEWSKSIKARRESYALTSIVIPFIERCIEYGILPQATEGDYEIVWSDLFAVSEKEKAEVGKIRSAALKEYNANPMIQDVIPAKAFLHYFLGFEKQQIEMIEQIQEEEMGADNGQELEDEMKKLENTEE